MSRKNLLMSHFNFLFCKMLIFNTQYILVIICYAIIFRTQILVYCEKI